MIALEIWKDIKGYEGIYRISNFGRVISSHKGSWRELKQFKEDSGYLKVNLCKDKKSTRKRVHNLVADSFCTKDESEGKLVVNHIDGDKSNNHFSNLEFVTQKENIRHYFNLNPNRSKTVLKVDLDNNNILGTYNSASEAAVSNGVSRTCIVHCCLGKRFSSNGYRWIYEEDYKNNGLSKINNRVKKVGGKKPKRVMRLDATTLAVLEVYESTREASLKMGSKGIKEALRGRNRMCCGYKWKYEMEEI